MERWNQKQKRELLHTGVIAAAVYNTARDSKRRPEPFKPSDIFPALREPLPELSEEEEIVRLNMFFQGVIATHKQNGA